MAVDRGHVKTAEELINLGANPNVKNRKNHALLLVCIERGYTKLAKLLIEHKADMNLKENDEYLRPIYYAIKRNRVEIVKLLVKNDVDLLQQKAGCRESALEFAKRIGQKEIIQIIVQQLIKNFELKFNNEEPLAKRQKFDEDCVICCHPRNGIYVMTPCGHSKTCELCCLKIIYVDESTSKCPVCRMSVNSYIKAFY